MAGSRPSAAELAAIPKIGEVKPLVITGRPTPPAKLAKMRADIEHSQVGQIIRRNKRKIIKGQSVVDEEARGVDPEQFLADNRRARAEELRSFIRASRDWWDDLPEDSREKLLDLYWRTYGHGIGTFKEWRLEVENVKLAVFGRPKPADQQWRDEQDSVMRWRRLGEIPLRRGW